jgi:hypothetical protein
MNKGVLMQINCIMIWKRYKISNKAKHVDTSKAIVVAEVLNLKKHIAQRDVGDLSTGVNRIW